MSLTMTPEHIADRFSLRRCKQSWRGTCPSCQYGGAGTFSLKTSRNGRTLVYCSNGCDQDALQRAVGMEAVAPDPRAAIDKELARVRNRESAMRLWRGSEVTGLHQVYLAARCLGAVATCPDLRFRPDCSHPEAGRLPAMVALVRDVAGEPMGVHRTYLRRDGSGKADVEPAKASLGPIWGGAVRLGPVGPDIAVGEGIETAAAAGVLLSLPAWAGLSASNLAHAMALPAEVRTVTIAVDRDPSGEQAARDATRRWRAEGRVVRMMVPDLPGQDAADVLRARSVHHG